MSLRNKAVSVRGLLKNKIVKNAGWIIGGKVANKLMVFLVGILTARYLGPGNYGLINYAATYTSFFASLCTLGINSVIIKEFVDHPEEEGETIGTALVLRVISSLFSAMMIVGIVMVVDHDEPLTIFVTALCSVGLIFQVFDTLNYWFQYRLQSKYSTIATFIAYVIVSVYKIVLLVIGKSVEWFAIATSIDYIAVAVVLVFIYFREGGSSFAVSVKKAKALLSSSYHFIASGLMISVYSCTDKIMLKQMLGTSDVGYYSMAANLSVIWTFLLSAIIDSLYPDIIKSYNTSREAFDRKNRQLYAIVIYFSLFMSALICVFAWFIISILYGKSYLPSVTPLRIIVWYTAFSYLGVARNAWIVCEEQQKWLKYLYAGAAVVNVILNLILIPVCGAAGAAVASLASQIATILFPALIPDLRPNARLMLEALCFRGLQAKEKADNSNLQDK